MRTQNERLGRIEKTKTGYGIHYTIYINTPEKETFSIKQSSANKLEKRLVDGMKYIKKQAPIKKISF